MSKIIKLDNGVEYIQLAKPVLNDETFLFVASVTEESDYVFLRQVKDKEVEIIKDEKLIFQLLEVVRVDLLEKLKEIQDSSNSSGSSKN